jgi:hypothetical protein
MDTREMESLLPQLDPAFERGAWLLHCTSPYLTDNLRQLVALTAPDCIACTNTVFDIVAGDSLRYERSKGQRGFAMYFGEHPAMLGPAVAWAAVIHEAAHYLTDRHPSRDQPDEGKAIKDWWGSWSKEDSHTPDWKCVCAHLAFRAMRLGVDVNVTALFQDYGGTDFLAGLRSELVSRADEPIEQILSGGHRATVAQSQAQTTAREPRSTESRWPKVMMMGEPVMLHKNGEVETMPDLLGRGGKRFASIVEFRKRGRRKRVA